MSVDRIHRRIERELPAVLCYLRALPAPGAGGLGHDGEESPGEVAFLGPGKVQMPVTVALPEIYRRLTAPEEDPQQDVVVSIKDGRESAHVAKANELIGPRGLNATNRGYLRVD